MNAPLPRTPPTAPPHGSNPNPFLAPTGGARPPLGQPTPASRLPSAAETLGWGGGTVTLIGIVAVTWDLWTTLHGWPLVTVLSLATAVLTVAAASVAALDDGRDDRLVQQLSTALWVMAGAASTWTSYVAVDHLTSGRPYLAVLAAASAATTMSAAAARRTGRDVWWATTVLAGTVAAFAGTALVSEDVVVRSSAVAVAGALALAAAVAWWPERTPMTQWLALSLAAGGAQAVLLMGPTAAVAVLTGAAMTATGTWVLLRGGRVIGWTAVGVAVVLDLQVLAEIVPGVFTLATGILAAGLAMTVGCIALVRGARQRQAP